MAAPRPIRIPLGPLLKDDEWNKAVDLATRKTQGNGGVLVLLGADDDCPAELAPALVERAHQVRADVPVKVILANREFEAWFLAAASSLRGHRGVREDAVDALDPESVRGAKEALESMMVPGSTYSETLDQPALASRLDIERARRSRSFDKFYRDLIDLLNRQDAL